MNKLTTLLSKESLAKAEKRISFFIYYALPAISLATLIAAILNTNNMGFSRQEPRGNLGWNILAIILFAKPIIFLSNKYLKPQSITAEQRIISIIDIPSFIKKNQDKLDSSIIIKNILPFLLNSIYSFSLYIMRLRKPLGIATFWLLFTHGFLWEIFWIRQGFGLLFNFGNKIIRSGLISLVALAIGAITSNKYSMQKLQKNWKPVQMVAYLAFFFGAIHTGNVLWMIIYFIAKYFERKDTGSMKWLTDRLKKAFHIVKNNKHINTVITKAKNNKKIHEKINKIKKTIDNL